MSIIITKPDAQWYRKDKERGHLRFPNTKRIKIEKYPMGGITQVKCKCNPIFIGRAEDNDIVLDEDYISNYHCKIFKKRFRWYIIDLESNHGTVLIRSRQRITVTKEKPIKLEKHDNLELAGNIQLMIS